MSRYGVRVARQADLPAVMDMFAARVAWLRHRHRSDQWSSVDRWEPKMRSNIARGSTWVLHDGNRPDTAIATVTLSRRGDELFWGPSQPEALYLAKLATDPDRAGQGLGSLLLAWTADLAHRHNLIQLRLDTWKTSPGLHDYYKKQGWTHYMTIDSPTRMSGTLFYRWPERISFDGLLESEAFDLPDDHAAPVSDDDMETVAFPIVRWPRVLPVRTSGSGEGGMPRPHRPGSARRGTCGCCRTASRPARSPSA